MKNFLKVLAAAMAGSAIHVGSAYLPLIPQEYAPAVSAGVAVGVAYGLKSPYTRTAIEQVFGPQVQPQPEPPKETQNDANASR